MLFELKFLNHVCGNMTILTVLYNFYLNPYLKKHVIRKKSKKCRKNK